MAGYIEAQIKQRTAYISKSMVRPLKTSLNDGLVALAHEAAKNIDINDNSPVFSSELIEISIKEIEDTENENPTIGLFNFTTCNGGTNIDKKVYQSKENEIFLTSQ